MLRILRALIGLVSILVIAVAAHTIAKAQIPSTRDHRAVGSWLGKAVQVCEAGLAPSVCVGAGRPAEALLMTPTLTADGLFIADDSLTFGLKHLTAHGQWRPTSATGFVADYAFVISTIPGTPAGSLAGLRARWQGQVLDDSTLVGHVNAIFTAGVPVAYQRLDDDQFPSLPAQLAPLLSAPTSFTETPLRCANPGTPGCPLVFKFTIKRLAP